MPASKSICREPNCNHYATTKKQFRNSLPKTKLHIDRDVDIGIVNECSL